MKEKLAVSVIIPLYNVEKYIGECLDSLLAQTFTNFEVIVVDDCSTDSSPAIVENYAPKFNGRLKLAHMKKNSGGAGFPRNMGIELARGEYIFFLDPDDTITPTALEELYPIAKKFDADVVHCEKWYYIPEKFWNNAEYRKQPSINTHPTGEKIFTTKPTVLTDNFERRIVEYSKRWLTWSVCLQFIRRNFIVENEIKFGDFYCEDLLFTLCEISCAKKYVVAPNIFYNYRSERENSAVNEKLNVSQNVCKRITALKKGIAYLDKFLNDIDFYSKRPYLKYILFDSFAQEILGYFYEIYAHIPAHALDDLLKKEFSKDVTPALRAFIFGSMNVNQLLLFRAQQKVAVLENELKSDRQQLALAQQRIAALETKLRRVN